MSADVTIEGNRLGDVDLCALHELDEELGAIVREDVDLVSVFELEASGVVLRSLDRLEIVLKFDFLGEALLLRVVTAKELGF